ncbi:MAG: hypothetical protein GXO01_03215, partial [Epsilonproteobacteria bacterium]|nr:hypothetical protein [Campylobacterota bacterium]
DSVYLIAPKKIFKIIEKVKKGVELNCKPLKEAPVFMADYPVPLVITRGDKYRVTMYDENLNALWTKAVDAKINRAEVIGKEIYLIGIKGGRFWIAKMSLDGEILNEKSFYKAGQGFDIARNDNGFVAVGYKYFDHLGDYVKRFVIVLLDKDLNFVTDMTYGDFESAGIRVFRVGNVFFGLQKMSDGWYYFVLFDKKGYLRWYKGLSFDRYYRHGFYDIRLLGRIFFSTDRGVFVLNSDKTIAKYLDYTNVVKIIGENRFITSGGIIIDDKFTGFENMDIINGTYNGKKYFFLGYKNDKGVICEY